MLGTVVRPETVGTGLAGESGTCWSDAPSPSAAPDPVGLTTLLPISNTHVSNPHLPASLARFFASRLLHVVLSLLQPGSLPAALVAWLQACVVQVHQVLDGPEVPVLP